MTLGNQRLMREVKDYAIIALGMLMYGIPNYRLPKDRLQEDIDAILSTGIKVVHGKRIGTDLAIEDLEKQYDAVLITIGANTDKKLGIEGEEYSLAYPEYLRHHKRYILEGNAAIIGGGSVAADCAVTAKQDGYENVEMFVRRRISDMRVTNNDRQELLEHNIDITTMTRVVKISKQENGLLTLHTVKTRFNNGHLEDIPNTEIPRPDFRLIIKALGSTVTPKQDSNKIIFAGDCKNGGSTIVEALASGLDAAKRLHQQITQ